MSSILEQFLPLPRGGIVYDAARLRNPQAAMFTADYWAERKALDEIVGGRGSVSVLRTQEGDWILRHYRRGGFAARISNDSYVWTGADATRSFREWRLLAALSRMDLPVPAPVAARFDRRGMLYRADIITVRIQNAITLAQSIEASPLGEHSWRRIGETVARFHRAGVYHADLNANNIMLTADQVYLLDFDRGRIRERGPWEQQVIARLKRSLEKLKAKQPRMSFEERDWQALLAGLATRDRGARLL
jgi:3-deoxy-D-manno-octulosonic acid kinase